MSDQEIQKVYDKLEELSKKFDEAIYIGNGKPAIMTRLERIEHWIKEEMAGKAQRIDWWTWAFRLFLLIILYKIGLKH